MKAYRFILILIISSFILSPLLSAIIVNPPAIPRDFTSAGTYYHSSGNNAYFAVDHVMTFTQVVVDSTYVQFNNTKLNITSPNRINISLDYINSSMTGGSSTSLRVAFYAQTTTGTAHFNISGFMPGVEYGIFKNNVSMTTATANATGSIHFSNAAWTTVYFKIFGGTTLADTNYIYAGGTAIQKTYQYYRSNLTKKAESADYGGTIYNIAEDDVYIYVGGDTTQKIYKYWKSNLTKKAESADYGGAISSIYIDDTYIYVAGDTTQKVYQYWKSNLTKKAESADYGGEINDMVGDSIYIYSGGVTTQKVYQYWKSNLTKKAESADYGGSINGLAEDDTYVYVGGSTTQKVYQYWKSNLTKKAETLVYGGSIADINNDDTYVYVGGATTRKVYQYWISNMTKKAETLNYGGTITAISVNSTYIYAGGTTTNKVYQYWKSNLTKKAESADYGGNIYTICANLSSDVYTPPTPAPWSNHAPTLTIEVPTNASVSVSRWPQLSVTVTDVDGNNSKIFWYTNASGVWTQIQSNTSILNTTVRKMNFTQASAYNTKYWWRVSANDTHSNTTETYYFTTLVASSSVTDVPFNFVAAWVGDTSINISWDVGGNNKTVIVRKVGSYPSNSADGTVVYNGTGANDTYFTSNLSTGWTDMYFPEYLFTQNSSISANNSVENFLQQSGIWDKTDWVFYNDPVLGLVSWGKALPPIFITLHNITYDAVNPYMFHTTGSCTLSLLLDNVSGSPQHYFHDIGLDIATRYYYRAWSLNGTVFSLSSTKLILAYSGTSNNVEETTANIAGYIVTDKTSTVRVLYGYTTAYGTNSTNVTISTSGAITKALSGLTPGRLYQYITYANDSTGNITFGNDPPFLTKPQAPTNTSTTLNFGTMKFNLSWDDGIGANKTVVRVKSTGYPTSPTDGTLVYNGTNNYTLYSFTLGTNYYFKAWSYANCSIPPLHEFSDNGTTFSLVGTGGLIINCFDENDHHNLTFNVKVSNQSGSQVYENNGCTNSHAINESLCPHGNDIQIIVSATGYHQRMYTINIYVGMIYILNAYLPPETAPGNGTENCELRPYIDSMTITNPAVDATITFTHTLDTMSSVEIYNASLYGTYGGWIFVSSDKYTFTPSHVIINESVLDANTTMIRVNYYYNYCTGGVASALYYLRVVETISTEYTDVDKAVENVLMQVKRYINSTGTFADVSSIFTDANGYVNIYLVPNAHYKIFLNKSGYDDIIGADYIPAPPNSYGQTAEKVFSIVLTESSDTIPYIETLFTNITYSFYPTTARHETNYTFWYNISSSDGKIEWFRMNVRYWNETTDTWVLLSTQNDSTHPNGGSLNYTLPNVSGKYVFECFFKKVGYPEYEFGETGSLIQFIVFLRQGLRSVPDYAWFIITIILMIVGMGFFMRYFASGIATGYIGLGIFAMMLLLKDIQVPLGGVGGPISGWVIWGITFLIYTVGVFLYSRI